MAETATSYASYLSLFYQERKALMESRFFPEDKYPYSVATTWKVSIDKLKESSPDSLPLLFRALYLAPDNIPKALLGIDDSSLIMQTTLLRRPVVHSLLHAHSLYSAPDNIDSTPLDTKNLSLTKLNSLLQPLIAYSLLSPGTQPESLSIHRLTQTILRDQLSTQESEKAKASLTLAFKKEWKFNPEQPSTWVIAKSLAPHLEVFCEKANCSEINVSTFLNNLGLYFQVIEVNLSKAIEYHTKALYILKKVYGEEHNRVATCLNNLGEAYRAQGNITKAIEFFTNSLAMLEKVCDVMDKGVATCMMNLGAAYHEQREDPSKIIGLYINALSILRAIYGDKDPEHVEIANCFSIAGKICQDQGNHSLAVDFYIKAIRIYEKIYPEGHPKLAACFNFIGELCRILGKVPDAIMFGEMAIDMSKKFYGEQHSQVALCMINLGMTYQDHGELSESMGLYNQSLAMLKRIHGEKHPNIAACLGLLSAGYLKQGDLSNAIECCGHGLAIAKQYYGEEHPVVFTLLRNLQFLQDRQRNSAIGCIIL